MATTDYTQPFPVEYPHIFQSSGGALFEMSCPKCGGNCHPGSPNGFFNDPSDLTKHITKVHKTDEDSSNPQDKTVKPLPMDRVARRELSEEDISQIRQGNGVKVISKKAVASKHKDSKIVKIPETMPLMLYPTVYKSTDGNHSQLVCFEIDCLGNSRVARGYNKGRNTSPNAPREFFQGVRGMAQHLTQSHKIAVESEAWVVQMCGTPIPQAQLQALQADRTGSLIPRTLAIGTGEPSRPKKPKGPYDPYRDVEQDELSEEHQHLEVWEGFGEGGEGDEMEEAGDINTDRSSTLDTISREQSSGHTAEKGDGWTTVGRDDGEEHADGEERSENNGEQSGWVDGEDEDDDSSLSSISSSSRPSTPDEFREAFAGTKGY